MPSSNEEGLVQLNPDPTGANKNVIRVLRVLPASAIVEYVTSGQVPLQEMVGLADEHGRVIGVIDGSLAASDEKTQELLAGVCTRLDLLLSVFDKNYIPPDDLGIGE